MTTLNKEALIEVMAKAINDRICDHRWACYDKGIMPNDDCKGIAEAALRALAEALPDPYSAHSLGVLMGDEKTELASYYRQLKEFARE